MATDGRVVISLSFDGSEADAGIKKIRQAFDRMATSAESSVEEINDELDKLGSGADSSAAEGELEDIGREADKTSEKLKDVERQKKKAVSPLRHVGDAFGGAFSALSEFSGGFLEGAVQGTASGLSLLGDRVKSKFEGIKELVSHIGETLLDVFIFDLMNQALDKTREKLGEIIAADTQLSNQLNTIKGNISAAFSPLWEAVYPTVVKVLNVVTAITSAIANLSAKIFGGAAVATNALNGEADAFGAVAEAAGSASQELGGFDEINTLPSSGGGGGGGGGAAGAEVTAGLAADLSYTFEDLYERLMSINWETVGHKISDALLNIDFEGIGKKITGGVRFVFKAAGMILRTVAWRDLGENIAKGLNEITTLLPDLGVLLADWLNAKIQFFLGLVSTYNWSQLGTSIAKGIMNFVNGSDWMAIGLAFSRLVIGLGDALIALVEHIDKDQIFDAIGEFIKGIDWVGVAKMFGEFLALALIEGIEYSPFGLVVKALDGLDIVNFDLSDWAKENVFGGGFSETAKEIDGLSGAENNLVNETTVADGVMKMFNTTISDNGSAMTEASISTAKESKAAGDVINKFKNLTSGTSKNTTATTKNTAAVKASTKALDENDEAAAAAVMTNAALALSAKNMSTTTTDSFVSMDEALSANLRGWKEYAIELTSVFTDISRKQDGFWSNMKSAAQTAATTVSGTFTNLPEAIATAFRKAWGSVLTALSGGAGTSLQGIADGLGKVFKSSINQMLSGLDDLFDSVERQLNETIVSIKRTQIGGTKPFATLSTVTLPSIPKLAKGAVIPANNEFLAILGDQRHGTNIEAPLDTIVEAMEIALQRNGSGSPEAIASAVRAGLAGMAVTFDGERVGRVVAAQIDANRRADGKFAYDLA